ncbi:MAG: MBL fold metallo-hydrolase [Halobacteriota archaeon]
MTVSDWGEWLPTTIEAADPETVAVWYLGCNGFAMKGRAGTTLWIDPYVGLGDPPRTIRMIPVPFDPADVTVADAVFATHEHTDHTHGPSQGPILERTGATFYGPDASLDVALADESWPSQYDVADAQFAEVDAGDTIEVGEFSIDVVETNDPDSTHPVGYLIEHDAGTIFHGGDTKPADSFASIGEQYDIDIGILAFGAVGNIPDKVTREPARTKWYSTENEIVRSASDLQIDRLVPTHWDMWKGLTADPTALHHHARSFEHPKRLDLVEIGDRIDL